MSSNENISIQTVEQAVSRWEESVHRISQGWDYIEEYCNDLSSHEKLADRVEAYKNQQELPSDVIARITATVTSNYALKSMISANTGIITAG